LKSYSLTSYYLKQLTTRMSESCNLYAETKNNNLKGRKKNTEKIFETHISKARCIDA
jgi:hypothetical protein